jgi:hypothetical protein
MRFAVFASLPPVVLCHVFCEILLPWKLASRLVPARTAQVALFMSPNDIAQEQPARCQRFTASTPPTQVLSVCSPDSKNARFNTTSLQMLEDEDHDSSAVDPAKRDRTPIAISEVSKQYHVDIGRCTTGTAPASFLWKVLPFICRHEVLQIKCIRALVENPVQCLHATRRSSTLGR